MVELVTLAIEFIYLAIAFVTLSVEFITLAQEFNIIELYSRNRLLLMTRIILATLETLGGN